MPQPWEMPGPIELPNGQLACEPHGNVVCPWCCVDYSFMDEETGEETASDEDEPIIYHARNSGTMQLKPASRFCQSSHTSPSDIFTLRFGQEGVTPPAWRMVSKANPKEMLMFTDGACSFNGSPNAVGGCGFVYHTKNDENLQAGSLRFRLEAKGPTGQSSTHTSQRAELRAAIGALGFRFWPGEGFKSLVIATASEYVVKGATTWCSKWLANGWLTSTLQPVANRDLWEELLKRISTFGAEGLIVRFWHIDRSLNKLADTAAKAGALKQPETEYSVIHGILV